MWVHRCFNVFLKRSILNSLDIILAHLNLILTRLTPVSELPQTKFGWHWNSSKSSQCSHAVCFVCQGTKQACLAWSFVHLSTWERLARLTIDWQAVLTHDTWTCYDVLCAPCNPHVTPLHLQLHAEYIYIYTYIYIHIQYIVCTHHNKPFQITVIKVV